MNKFSVGIGILVVFIVLAACSNKEEEKNQSPSSSQHPNVANSPTPTSRPTTTEGKEQVIASYSSTSQEKVISIYLKAGTPVLLQAQLSDKSEKLNNRSNVPITKDWEKEVTKDNIFVSFPSASNTNWLLLTSGPAAGQMGKTLYKSDDKGKSWILVNDISQAIEGYVTGVSFRDEKNGWVGATYHGEILVPLYRTKDGGESWGVQQIAIPKGYKYGNVYPPTFDTKDAKQGTLKIEFVNDTDKKIVEFKTSDGGETWMS